MEGSVVCAGEGGALVGERCGVCAREGATRVRGRGGWTSSGDACVRGRGVCARRGGLAWGEACDEKLEWGEGKGGMCMSRWG